jgi:hypothetical protein
MNRFSLRTLIFILGVLIIFQSLYLLKKSFVWNDELWTIFVVSSFNWDSFFIHFAEGNNTHPIFYNLLLKFFSPNEFVSITFYKFINFLINYSFFFFFLLISYIQKRSNIYYFLLLIFFLNPLSIYLVDELRPYSIALFLVGAIILIAENLQKTKIYRPSVICFLSILISILAITNYFSSIAILVVMINLLLGLFLQKKKLEIFLLLLFPLLTIIFFQDSYLGPLERGAPYIRTFDQTIYYTLISLATCIGVLLLGLFSIGKKGIFKNLFIQNLIFSCFLMTFIYHGELYNFFNVGHTYIMIFSLYLLLILSIKKINFSIILIIFLSALLGFAYNLNILFSPKIIELNRINPAISINEKMCDSDFILIDWRYSVIIYEKIIRNICINNPKIYSYNAETINDKADLTNGKKKFLDLEVKELSNTYVLDRVNMGKGKGKFVSDGLYYIK